MKRVSFVFIAMCACLVLFTGCDRLKKFMAPQRKVRATVAGVPDLEILGVSEEEQVALRDLLVVRGLLQQAADYVVIINTQLVRKGESMYMKVDRQTYTVTVLSVTEMRVVLEAKRAAE